MSDPAPPKSNDVKPPDEKELKRLRGEYGLDEQQPSGSALAYSGLEFGGIVAGAIVLGLVLDSKFDTKPWWLLSLTVFGMVGGMVRLIRRVMRNAEK